MQILEGVKVIDVTQFISGSRCTQILADMGAEVVKVEPPQGDTLRLIFSLVPGAERNYSVLNRNKYGIAVNWREPEGQEIIRRLAARCDVLVHNLIPGTMERFKLGYSEIRKINNDIIYCAISGFGTESVNSERAAFDIIAQATGGHFWNDQVDMRMPSNYWGDMVSGAYAAIAILMAVIHLLKTGQGQFIDLSMQDVMYWNNYRVLMDRALEPALSDVKRELGRNPSDVLNSDDRMPFYGFFKSRDGKVAIVALTARQWKALADIIGRPEMATDERYSNIVAQIHHHNEAVELIESWTRDHPSEEIISILEKNKIPCGIAYTSSQANNDPNLKHRGMYSYVSHSAFGDIAVPGFPYRFSETEGSIRMAAPGLGEHTRMVLEEWLGYDQGEVDALYAKGIVL